MRLFIDDPSGDGSSHIFTRMERGFTVRRRRKKMNRGNCRKRQTIKNRSKIFSGFIDSTPTGEAKAQSMHYILIESENDPETDPLLVWSNGGPGAGSEFGLVRQSLSTHAQAHTHTHATHTVHRIRTVTILRCIAKNLVFQRDGHSDTVSQ